MIIELPIVYLENADEVNKGEESGYKVNAVSTTEKTTFIIPDICLVRINPSSNDKQTTICFDEDSYITDLDYETVAMMFKDALRK